MQFRTACIRVNVYVRLEQNITNTLDLFYNVPDVRDELPMNHNYESSDYIEDLFF